MEYVGRVKASESVALVVGGDTEMERVQVVDGDDLSRYQLGMFGEFQFGLDDRIFFTGGVRYDENEDFGEHLSARVTSAYIVPAGPEGALKLRASAGNGFRAPSLYEVTTNRNAVVPMADLIEESSSGYDIGLEYYRDSGLSAQLTWFEQSIEDEIIYDMQNWTGYLQADGRSRSKGAELQLSVPMSRWAQVDAVFTRNLTQTALDLPRVHRPGKAANVSLYLYPVESLVLLLNNRWDGDVLDVDRQPMDSYQVLDISATYTLVPGWEVFGRVENALDEEYQEVRGYYTSRRAAYLGTRFSF
ncbi:MAG: TonB-dependent receptor [Cellvibrionaceae bacterium]|nr:TonB-dependent receptor [Cellvibrionaceae bacterium]